MPLPSVVAELLARRLRPLTVLVFALAGLAALLACGGGAAGFGEDCDGSGYCGEFVVGGPLYAATWLDADRMYLADGEGNIRLLNVRTGAVRTVWAGPGLYKGITLLDGRLYLSDLEPMCAELRAMRESSELLREKASKAAYPTCPHIPLKQSLMPVLLEMLGKGTGGQVVSFRVDGEGNLSDRKVVIDLVTTFDWFHGLNGLTNDGEYIYLSIGSPAQNQTAQARQLREVAEQDRSGARTDHWGTIVRFIPPLPQQLTPNQNRSNTEVEIYAAGLRNTYGIALAPDGTIYGGDNDVFQPAGREPRPNAHLEELNALVPGGFYGYPHYGSNAAPAAAGVTEPVAIIPGVSTAAAYANRDGVYLSYVDREVGPVIDRFDYATFTPERIFQGGSLVTALLEREGLLYAVAIDGKVLVIDPEKRPETLRQRLRQAGKWAVGLGSIP